MRVGSATRSLFSRLSRGSLLGLILAAFTSTFSETEGWKLSGKAGLNYDFISQDYYLRTVDTLNIDSDSLTELKSLSDRIDEKGVNLRLQIEHNGRTGVVFGNNLFVTDDKIRNQFQLQVRWGVLRLDSDAEIKSNNKSNVSAIYDSRLLNSSRLAIDLYKTENWHLQASQEFEYLGYNDRTSSVYGYRQHETRLRLAHHIGAYSSLELNVRYDDRDCYDSTQLDFGRQSGELRYDLIGTSRSIQTNLYFERKNYSWAGSDDDYLHFAPYFYGTFAVSDKIELAPRLDALYYNYDLQSLATFDHWRVLTELELKYHYDLLSTVYFGLARENFKATEEQYGEQDYRSSGIIAGYENLSSRRFSISLETQLGKRDYSSEDSDFYTDHVYMTADLLGDLKLTDRIRFSVIGSTDFEYHDEKEDDVFVYLLSGNLTYKFR